MRIPAWNEFHETHESRKLKNLRYLNIPNKHDGEGYAAIMAHPRGPEIFAAWILILQVASKCKDRGILRKPDGKPVDSSGLAAKTRAPREIFDIGIPFLCEIGWLELEPGESGAVPGESPAIRRNHPDRVKGSEVKSIEGEGIEKEGTGSPPAPSRFQKPSIEEVKEYAKERGLPAEAEKFFDYYTSNGWRVGKNPMKDWRGAFRNWERNAGTYGPSKKPDNILRDDGRNAPMSEWTKGAGKVL